MPWKYPVKTCKAQSIKLVLSGHGQEEICKSLVMFLFQVQTLKVLVNLSSNPDMMDDIVQAQVIIYGLCEDSTIR